MATAGYLPPVVVEILGNDKDLVAKLIQAKTLLREFATEDTKARLGVTLGEFTSELTAARAELLNLAKQVTAARIGADAAPFWADIAKLRAELAAVSPLDINVGTTLGTALAQIETLRGELALVQAQQMAAGAGGAGTSGFDALAGGGSAAGGGAANAVFGMTGLLHMSHLLTPEIVGLATALFSVGAGFAALGIASIGAASDIYKGSAAVSAAKNAIAAAIPGTTQWQTGVTNLGLAWSQIPANLQPAVHAIQNMLGRMGSSPMATEIQRFLGGQANILSSMFSGAGSAFQPLIMATEHAIVTVEGLIKKSIGSGSLQRFVAGISHMVGPATVELFQLATAIMHIAAGFAKAVTDGQGMEVLVGLFQRLASLANSKFFQGFVSGWVDFDRVLSTVLGALLHVINVVTGMSGSFAAIAPILGFVASGLLAAKGAAWLLQKQFPKLQEGMKGLASGAISVGLFSAGLVGAVKDVSTLVHASDPLSGALHAVGSWLGFASKKGTSFNDTLGGAKKALNGAIPVTANFTAAQDLLVRASQATGSAIASAATGFATFTVKVPQSYAKMLANLQNQNGTLATWAADAQQLLKMGVNPGAVTSMAQQAPQELGVALAHLKKTGAAGLDQLNTVWQEKLMVTQMSSSKGVSGMTQAMVKGFQSGTPIVHNAAAALATTLGAALRTPFTGTQASIQAIAKQLSSLSPATSAALAGALGKLGLSASKAAVHTAAVQKHAASMGSTFISLAGNVGMVAVGFSGTVSAVKKIPAGIAKVGGALGSIVGKAASAASSVASFAATLGHAAISGLASLGELVVGMIGVEVEGETLNAVLGVGVIGALVLLGIAIYELVTHWKTVWKAIVAAARVAEAGLQAAWSAIEGAAKTIWASIGGIVKSAWGVISGVIKIYVAISVAYIKVAWALVSTVFKVTWDLVAGVVKSAWAVISGLVKVGVAIITGIIKFFAALFTGNWTAMWNDIKNTARTVWNDILGIFTGAIGAMLGAGKAIMNALASGFTAVINAVTGAAKSVWNAVIGVFSSAVHFFEDIGKSIIQGLVNGIKGATHLVSSAIHGVVSLVKHIPVIGGLIGSPSPYFIEVGHAISEGLGLGVTGGAGKALTAVRALGAAVTGAGAGMRMSGLAGAGVGMGGGHVINQQIHLTFTGTAPQPAAIGRMTQQAVATENRKLLQSLRGGTSRIGYR